MKCTSAVAQLAPDGFLSPGRFSKNDELIAAANSTQKTTIFSVTANAVTATNSSQYISSTRTAEPQFGACPAAGTRGVIDGSSRARPHCSADTIHPGHAAVPPPRAAAVAAQI